ncbi:MAG: hypothetical protein ACI4ES_01085 [Roseburia sp.]
MKKKYKAFALKVMMIVLGVFIVSAAVLTYQEALKIRDEYVEVCYEKGDFITDIRYKVSEESSTEKVIKSAYKALEKAYVHKDNIGFYSELKDDKGAPIAYSQNYMIVTKENGDMRIVLLEDDFPSDAADSMEEIGFDGVCDDTYLYPKKIVWTSIVSEKQEYILDDIDKKDGLDTISFDEWVGNEDYDVTINYMGTIYGKARKKEKYNEEAKKICEKVYEEFTNGDRLDDQTSKGIFTTYVAGTGYIVEKAVMPYVYVFHPIAIAMSELIGVYMILFGVTIILEIIIWMMVKRIYMKHSESEK